MISIDEIISDYSGKLYYFSLKKTSDTYEAEDLTQEILFEILVSLKKGICPHDTAAWVWKIARNRYARWADRKHKSLGNVPIDSMTDEISDNSAVEDDILSEEERELLYRELSLLTADYRWILCAYYFENMSIAEISERTALPPGTIKRKLYESRQQIKEGMKMSRTYGTRSFSPENIVFSQNWEPSTGEGGHRLIKHLIPQNILLEAYDNPCTVEDLSLALGIAVPYIEDEIKPLLEYGLLIKEGTKYKTGIVILSKDTQEKLYDIGMEITDKLVPVIQSAIEEIGEKLPADFPQSFEDFKVVLAERLCCVAFDRGSCRIHTIKHHDGSEWALMGMEICDKTSPWLEVSGNEKYHQVIMLGNRTDLDHLEADIASVPSFTWDELAKITKNSHENEIHEIFDEFAKVRIQTLDAAIPAHLRKTALYNSNIDFRYLVIHRLIDEGYITLHEDMYKSAMGIYNITY